MCSASAPGDISYNAKFMLIKFLDSLNLYQTSFIDAAVVSVREYDHCVGGWDLIMKSQSIPFEARKYIVTYNQTLMQ